MTPTLAGRWQTRYLLLTLVGVPITYIFGDLYNAQRSVFLLLLAVGLLGILWDPLYHTIQQRRWDHDWPALFQFGAAVWEGCFLWGLLTMTPVASYVGIPIATETTPGVTWQQFAAHYSCVWLALFIASQSLMRLLFPRWRYHGGEWLT